ncbi:MAG: protein translocase subunit SecF [Anaerolineae bacterium]|nr:protein translocase subunit SecF [Anaerolineae bacterium]
MFHIVEKRYLYFAISLIAIIPGLIALGLWGLPLSIDFLGGSLIEVQFNQPTVAIQPADVKAVLAELDFGDSVVQTTEGNVVLIRTRYIQDLDTKNRIYDALRAKYGDLTEQQFASVGPSVGAAVAQRAAGAVLAASVVIALYIAWAFRRVPHPFRYGVAAIVSMLHDVLVVVGLSAIMGKLLGWQVDSLFLTALLTVIGFSVHDTIVVFDRIRENLTRYRGEKYEEIVNFSIVQTLARSINTSLTVLLTLLAMALLGGVTVRHFVIWLLIGIASGMYSSIFNAAPILVVWETGEWRNWPLVRQLLGRRQSARASQA